MWASMFVADSLFAAGVQAVLSRVMPDAHVLHGLPSEPDSAGVDLLIVETSVRHSIEVGRAWIESHPDRPLIMFTPTGDFDPIAPGLYLMGKTMPGEDIEQAFRVIAQQM